MGDGPGGVHAVPSVQPFRPVERLLHGRVPLPGRVPLGVHAAGPAGAGGGGRARGGGHAG
ncbi:hypothetical protein D7Y13_20755 [Corallococcus praedator]|uniref:Uncharacterized protein n=1 Tax=Corallococcus praedator TaxID=2316724 RepID=A0ABX9QFY4_9BACT|nr:hypothetical protein D7Y13_20755 [Corallococcus praedator]